MRAAGGPRQRQHVQRTGLCVASKRSVRRTVALSLTRARTRVRSALRPPCGPLWRPLPPLVDTPALRCRATPPRYAPVTAHRGFAPVRDSCSAVAARRLASPMRRRAHLLAAWAALLQVAHGLGVKPSELYVPAGQQLALLPDATLVGVVETAVQGVVTAEACAQACRDALPGCSFFAFCNAVSALPLAPVG